MCINKIEIQPKYWRHKIYVKCGHCPACLQEAANKRANRIRSEVDQSKYDIFFVTLTYENRFIPYIWRSDLEDFVLDHPVALAAEESKGDLFSNSFEGLSVYRDANPYLHYNRHSKKYTLKVDNRVNAVYTYSHLDFESSTSLDFKQVLNVNYKYLRKHKNAFGDVEFGKIGVIHYRDVEDYMKRYRQYLKRRGYDFRTSYFACSEYGPTTHRPHHHLLVFVPKGCGEVAKSALIENWHFCNLRRHYKLNGRWHTHVESAKAPSEYISSYVNCDSSIKGLLKDARMFRPHHSYSKGFGFSKNEFTFPKVLQALREGNLFYDTTISVNGVLTPAHIPLPKYVISYWFPKFKGFSYLTSESLLSVVNQPAGLYRYKEDLKYTDSDIKYISTMLRNKMMYICCKYNLDPSEYAFWYVRAWTTYNSNLLKFFHSRESNPLESYDNIKSFYDGSIDSEFVRPFAEVADVNSLHFETDPNHFHDNLVMDNYWRQKYYRLSKDKKVKNLSYSETNFEV